MASNQFRKTIEEIVKENPESLLLIVDEIQGILDQPPLPPGHPDAGAQRLAKRRAQATMDHIDKRVSAELLPLALKALREIIDMAPLPADHPAAAALQEEKRKARILLLRWNAHYGPGGPYEGLGPKKGGDG